MLHIFFINNKYRKIGRKKVRKQDWKKERRMEGRKDGEKGTKGRKENSANCHNEIQANLFYLRIGGNRQYTVLLHVLSVCVCHCVVVGVEVGGLGAPENKSFMCVLFWGLFVGVCFISEWMFLQGVGWYWGVGGGGVSLLIVFVLLCYSV